MGEGGDPESGGPPDSIRSWQESPAVGRVPTPIEVRRQVYVRLQTAPGRGDAFQTTTGGRRRSHRVTDLPVPDLEAATRAAAIIREAVFLCRAPSP
jgi:hypothetical protein